MIFSIYPPWSDHSIDGRDSSIETRPILSRTSFKAKWGPSNFMSHLLTSLNLIFSNSFSLYELHCCVESSCRRVDRKQNSLLTFFPKMKGEDLELSLTRGDLIISISGGIMLLSHWRRFRGSKSCGVWGRFMEKGHLGCIPKKILAMHIKGLSALYIYHSITELLTHVTIRAKNLCLYISLTFPCPGDEI